MRLSTEIDDDVIFASYRYELTGGFGKVTVAVVSYVEDALICYYAYLPVAAARERGVKASGFQRAQIYSVQSAYSYLFFIKKVASCQATECSHFLNAQTCTRLNLKGSTLRRV